MMDNHFEAELPPPLRLALAYAPRAARAPTLALFLLDTRLAGFVRRGGEPLMAQMRLAWWRDTLRGTPADRPRGDPLLDMLRAWRTPAPLVALVDGWEQLLAEEFDREAITAFAGGRAKACAALAQELGERESAVEPAAWAWALGDLAGNLSDSAERARVLEVARQDRYVSPSARALRPLAILGGLGRRALAKGGVPLLDGRGAALAALRLGMLGR